MRLRHGLSLLELVVVMAIVGALGALMVPAVQRSRDESARAECMNRLRQIGIANHSFHAVKSGFPPAIWNLPGPGKVSVHWIPHILPYIDHEAVYRQYNFNTRWSEVSNDAANETMLSLFLCPSVPGRRTAFRKRAPTDYSATCALSRPNAYPKAPLPAEDATMIGVLGVNVYRRITDIHDGASNTLMVAEVAGGPDEWVMGTPIQGAKVPGSAWANPGNILKLGGFNPILTETPGTCAVNCTNNNEIYSFHQGGANALLADGAIRFLSVEIDLDVAIALFTRSGGEAVALRSD